MRTRRALLRRELTEIDAWMLDHEIAPRRAEPVATLGLRYVGRAIWLAVPVALLAVLMSAVVDCAPAHVVVVHQSPGLVRVGADRFVVTRAWIEQVATVGVHVEPEVELGAIVGLRVREVDDVALGLDIDAGDVIVAVDDHWLDDPNGARDAWTTARTAERFHVVVRCRGDFRVLWFDVIG